MEMSTRKDLYVTALLMSHTHMLVLSDADLIKRAEELMKVVDASNQGADANENENGWAATPAPSPRVVPVERIRGILAEARNLLDEAIKLAGGESR